MLDFIPVDFLAELYTEGETTYTIEEGERVTKVIVDRLEFILSPEAHCQFEGIHDEWELSVCEKYPHDAFVGGNFIIFTFGQQFEFCINFYYFLQVNLLQ